MPQATPASELRPEVREALQHSQTIDITTTGRRTGEPRRIEIVIFSFDGRLYISGMPRAERTRAWLLNLRADPRLTVHLKQAVEADLPATAREITDPQERRIVLEPIAHIWRRELEPMVEHSPLIEVAVPGFGPAGR